MGIRRFLHRAVDEITLQTNGDVRERFENLLLVHAICSLRETNLVHESLADGWQDRPVNLVFKIGRLVAADWFDLSLPDGDPQLFGFEGSKQLIFASFKFASPEIQRRRGLRRIDLIVNPRGLLDSEPADKRRENLNQHIANYRREGATVCAISDGLLKAFSPQEFEYVVSELRDLFNWLESSDTQPFKTRIVIGGIKKAL
jgi:hypothetical protein